MTRWQKSSVITLGIVSALIVGFFVARNDTPRLERDWEVDQAVPATVSVDGDVVTIQNVRNYTYRSETDYTPQYYDTTVRLSELESVDYLVELFGEIDIGAAHTFLSFGFKDGQQIAISVEIRKEKGEVFSPLMGVLNQYELMYVIADERDVIDLRVNHRHDEVFLYPTTASPEAAQRLFLSMLDRAGKLMVEPEFYNTLTNNCTTNIVRHINEITGQETIPFDYRLVLPAGSDELAQSLGFIAPGISIAEARERYRVNDLAAKHAGSPEFSRLIREGREIPSEEVVVAKVVRVLDGDTIEVEQAGEQYRVRYIGVDTPEMNYERPPAECLATIAKQANESLVLGREVVLEKDVSETDTYGRLLRYVRVAGEDVGAQLLSQGYAKILTVPPDVDRTNVYRSLENEARSRSLGLWGSLCEG